MDDMRIKRLAKAGVFAAVTLLLTAVVSVPMPGGVGYFNLGDAGVLSAAMLLGGAWGAACAGIGAAMADILLGFSFYAPATLLIKGTAAWLCSRLFSLLPKRIAHLAPLLVSVLIPLGYFLYEALLYGVPSAGANVWGNAAQALVGALLAYALSAVIQKAERRR